MFEIQAVVFASNEVCIIYEVFVSEYYMFLQEKINSICIIIIKCKNKRVKFCSKYIGYYIDKCLTNNCS